MVHRFPFLACRNASEQACNRRKRSRESHDRKPLPIILGILVVTGGLAGFFASWCQFLPTSHGWQPPAYAVGRYRVFAIAIHDPARPRTFSNQRQPAKQPTSPHLAAPVCGSLVNEQLPPPGLEHSQLILIPKPPPRCRISSMRFLPIFLKMYPGAGLRTLAFPAVFFSSTSFRHYRPPYLKCSFESAWCPKVNNPKELGIYSGHGQLPSVIGKTLR